MKQNITLAIDKELLRKVKHVAVERGKSVNALLVEHLKEVVDLDPEGRPLVKNCESTRVPGMFLLGYRFGRTFASPYLRGIARDAEYVAKRIAREKHNAEGVR